MGPTPAHPPLAVKHLPGPPSPSCEEEGRAYAHTLTLLAPEVQETAAMADGGLLPAAIGLKRGG